jgi:hypothetical protein
MPSMFFVTQMRWKYARTIEAGKTLLEALQITTDDKCLLCAELTAYV